MTNAFRGYIPPELIDSIRANKCVLFVGSGLSSKVTRSNGKPLPSWHGLLTELFIYAKVKRADFWGNPNDILEMLNEGNLLVAAQELQEILTSHDFGDFINSVFRDKNVRPTNTHLLITKIPFRCVLTTNYDNLIEGAFALSNSGAFKIKFTQEDLLNIPSPLRKDDFFIFKVHGDIDRLSTIVLGSRDYQKLFFRSPEYRQFLETIFSVYTVLFIGFSGTDSDIDNIIDKLSTIYSRTIDKHYILLPEKKFNSTAKRRLLLDKRLEVVEYGIDAGHTQVDAFISDLSRILENKPLTSKRKDKLYDVFLSYSREDKLVVRKIKECLSENGYKTFLDEDDLTPGTLWQDEITKAIVGSNVMIVIFTKESFKKNYVLKEMKIGITRALDEKITLIPIVIGDINIAELPDEIISFQVFKLNYNFDCRDLLPLYEILSELKE